MCGRFNLIATEDQLIDGFKLHRLPRYEKNYNIPPGQKILTVVKLDDGSYKAVYLYWGLIPHWAKERKISQRLINARAETVAEKPAFKQAYQQRRCLIPATGFYEWQIQPQGGKQAYCISSVNSGVFAFAGLWEYWDKGAETVYSCSIITTAANSMMTTIHQRMPVIITEDDYSIWLDKQVSMEATQGLLRKDSYQSMQIRPVSDWVNNPYHNDPNCLN